MHYMDQICQWITMCEVICWNTIRDPCQSLST